MLTYGFIFARGGSKELPGKNTRSFGGKPLLTHTIELASSIVEIDQIFVSTEDSAIGEVAKAADVTVIPRPYQLAQDDTPEWLAWKHAVDWVENAVGPFDRFVSLPVTSPLRASEDVTRCLDALSDQVDMIVAISESIRNPWFNMVTVGENGFLKTVCTPEGEGHIHRRQDCPATFDLTTVAYVTTPLFIKMADGVFGGRTKGVIVPRERSIDIDTAYDFEIAECIWSARNSKA